MKIFWLASVFFIIISNTYALNSEHASTSFSPTVVEEGEQNVPSTVAENRFNVTRPLRYYGNRLGDDFLQDLAALRANGHWIDGGSGEGIAAEHYHQLGGENNAQAMMGNGDDAGTRALQAIGALRANQRASVTGITYHMVRNGNRNYNNRLRHLVGRLLEDIPDAEIGKADVISDVYGVFAYSNRLDVAMQKYLTALKPAGKLYIFSAHMDRSRIDVGGGRSITLLDWLRSIQGVQVEVRATSIKITKTGQPVRIPRLTFVSDNNQTPPARVFNSAAGNIEVAAGAAVDGTGTDFTRRRRFVPPGGQPVLSDETLGYMRQALGYNPLEGE